MPASKISEAFLVRGIHTHTPLYVSGRLGAEIRTLCCESQFLLPVCSSRLFVYFYCHSKKLLWFQSNRSCDLQSIRPFRSFCIAQRFFVGGWVCMPFWFEFPELYVRSRESSRATAVTSCCLQPYSLVLSLLPPVIKIKKNRIMTLGKARNPRRDVMMMKSVYYHEKIGGLF